MWPAGKTTFIKNIFASYAQDANLKVNDVPGPTSKEEFVNNPEKLMTEIVVKDVANMTAYHYRVQDTPGRLVGCMEFAGVYAVCRNGTYRHSYSM